MTALLNILVIEDNDVDLERISRCLREAELPNPLHFALDGEEALDQLRGANGREQIDSPRLILLDLAMPRMNGFEFLVQLRGDPDLASTPVVVLTTSDRDKDIEQAVRLGAADYLIKPITSDQLAKIVVSFDAHEHAIIVDERTYTVVVIDREVSVRERVMASAMGTGWIAATFDSPADSMEHIERQMPDVLIVDRACDDTNSVDVLEQFCALPDSESARIYLATNSSVPGEDAQRARDLGVSITRKDILADADSFRDFLERWGS